MLKKVNYKSLLADESIRSLIANVQHLIINNIGVEEQILIRFESGHVETIKPPTFPIHEDLNGIGMDLVETHGRIREMAFIGLCWTVRLRTPTWAKSFPIPIMLPTVQPLIVFSGRNARKTRFVKVEQPIQKIYTEDIEFESLQIFDSNDAIYDGNRRHIEHIYDGAYIVDTYHMRLED